MMTNFDQINEIANIICNYYNEIHIDCDDDCPRFSDRFPMCDKRSIADEVFSAGYHRMDIVEDELVEEIIEVIRKY